MILGSASPRRRALLQSAGLTFLTIPADIDESVRAGEGPSAYALRMARGKAAAVARRHPGSIVIGADTIVVNRGSILGKPDDRAAARAMLEGLRGRRHEVMTGVACAWSAPASGGKTGTANSAPILEVDVAVTAVWLRAFSDSELTQYLDSGDPMDKAGGYAIQHRTFRPVATLVGSESNVIGLPLGLTMRLLEKLSRRLRTT